jgi:hypothetical protein
MGAGWFRVLAKPGLKTNKMAVFDYGQHVHMATFGTSDEEF